MYKIQIPPSLEVRNQSVEIGISATRRDSGECCAGFDGDVRDHPVRVEGPIDIAPIGSIGEVHPMESWRA